MESKFGMKLARKRTKKRKKKLIECYEIIRMGTEDRARVQRVCKWQEF